MVPRDLATPITYNQLCQELRAQISTELKEYSEIIQSRDGISKQPLIQLILKGKISWIRGIVQREIPSLIQRVFWEHVSISLSKSDSWAPKSPRKIFFYYAWCTELVYVFSSLHLSMSEYQFTYFIILMPPLQFIFTLAIDCKPVIGQRWLLQASHWLTTQAVYILKFCCPGTL